MLGDPIESFLPWHYWDAPDPTGHPPTTTVVIKSRCGRSLNLPAFQVKAWENAQTPPPSKRNACPTCLNNTPSSEHPKD